MSDDVTSSTLGKRCYSFGRLISDGVMRKWKLKDRDTAENLKKIREMKVGSQAKLASQFGYSTSHFSHFFKLNRPFDNDLFVGVIKVLCGDDANPYDYGIVVGETKEDWEISQPTAEEQAAIPIQAETTTPQHNLRRCGKDLLHRTTAIVDQYSGKTILEEIHKRLTDEEGGGLLSLVGMAGVGKTDTALRYAWQYLTAYRGGVFWCNAHDGKVADRLVTLIKSYANILVPDELPPEDQLRYCWQKWPSDSGKVLFVIDDVTEPNHIKELRLINDSRFHFLCTSEHKMPPQVKIIPPSLSEAVSMMQMLLGKDSRLDDAGETLSKLCDWLGRLPLALEVMGRYLQLEDSITIDEAFEDLEACALEYPIFSGANLTSIAERGAQSAFELSWERLLQDARCLACVISLLSPDPFPWSLMNEAMADILKEGRLRPARQSLTALHLLESVGDDLYTVNSLVRTFFKSKIAEIDSDQIYHRCLCTALINQTQKIPEKPFKEDLDTFTSILSHAEVAAAELLSDSDPAGAAQLFTGLVRYYRGNGMFRKGLHWAEQGLRNAIKHFTERDLQFAQAHYDLGLIAYFQRDAAKAKTHLEQALALNEAICGVESLEVAKVLLPLASLTRGRPDFDEAIVSAERALWIREKELGEDSLGVAEAQMSLAVTRFQQQDTSVNNLIQQVTNALAVRRENLPPNHADIAQSLDLLAKLYERQEHYEDAEACYEEAKEINEAMLGENHPQTAVSYNNLAKMLVRLKTYDQAEALYEKAIGVFEACGIVPSRQKVEENLAQLRLEMTSAGKHLESQSN
ncbi:tetratricopeptide repeat protein [Oscillatoria sp. CS-180]|uniref:tetratricopeptide repeat protein n=1 Tax=Oscillatoria sp. CS-180 TaxID=3021720 RepID=UPI00232B3CAC|nr:tetratricopeptide repeat protein [Oscillatoria sp. CS-180]MDB9526962.1 tetratricopeptide repeat protein [Oscillatoria sp. CS-180]